MMDGNFGVDVWDPLELNCNYFGDPLISHLAPLLSQEQTFFFLNTLAHELQNEWHSHLGTIYLLITKCQDELK